MKVIYIMADTMRRDHVGLYGHPPWGAVRTPNLERFGAQSSVFDNAYIGSFPTVPNRRDTQLGRGDLGLPFNRWKALEPEETTFLQKLTRKKIPSMLITDTQNNVTKGINLFRDYTAWTCNRGQEGDTCWMDENVPLEYPVPKHLIRYRADMWHQVLVNRAHRRVETDWFAPGTYRLAMDWLERNYKRKSFFLWIDTFDPHEPWDPPQHYIDMYDPGFKGRIFEAPTYGVRREMGISARELRHIRARYAAEVTMVDTWFGHLMDKVRRLSLLDETVIIFTSDHGTCFDGPGDFGMIHKMPTVGADGMCMSAGRPSRAPLRHFPLSQNTVRVPLIIRAPGIKPRRIKAIVQPWDMTATILDLFGLPVDKAIIGRSLLPLVQGKTKKARDMAVTGNNALFQAMTGHWMYSVWRGERGPALYDLVRDPGCRSNQVTRQRDVARKLHAGIVSFIEQQNVDAGLVAELQAV